MEPDHVGLEALAAPAGTGRLRPARRPAFPLADAAEAHALIKSGSTRGKIILAL